MIVRRARKTDFNNYYKLGIEGLKYNSKLTDEKLKITLKTVKKEFENTIKSRRRLMLFAIEDGKIIGYIIGTMLKNAFEKKSSYLDDIFIKEGYRRKGYGTQLMNEFIKLMKNKKVKKIRLGVRTNNEKAINLYKKLGFAVKNYEMEKLI